MTTQCNNCGTVAQAPAGARCDFCGLGKMRKVKGRQQSDPYGFQTVLDVTLGLTTIGLLAGVTKEVFD